MLSVGVGLETDRVLNFVGASFFSLKIKITNYTVFYARVINIQSNREYVFSITNQRCRMHFPYQGLPLAARGRPWGRGWD